MARSITIAIFATILGCVAAFSFPWSQANTVDVSSLGEEDVSSDVFNRMDTSEVGAFPIGRRSTMVTAFDTALNERLLPYHKNVEEYLSMYVPTFKCYGGLFCRAILTAYRNKQTGKMVVNAGYILFSPKIKQGRVSPWILYRITRTTSAEIKHYAKLLMREINAELPDICNFTEQHAIAALTSAIYAMWDCKYISSYSCSHSSFITTC